MLIRQYSIRTLLKVTALCAVLSLFFHYAWSGSPWAVCLVIAMIGLIIFFLVQSLAFLVLWSISSSAGAVKQPSSPFASSDAARPRSESPESLEEPEETEPETEVETEVDRAKNSSSDPSAGEEEAKE